MMCIGWRFASKDSAITHGVTISRWDVQGRSPNLLQLVRYGSVVDCNFGMNRHSDLYPHSDSFIWCRLPGAFVDR